MTAAEHEWWGCSNSGLGRVCPVGTCLGLRVRIRWMPDGSLGLRFLPKQPGGVVPGGGGMGPAVSAWAVCSK